MAAVLCCVKSHLHNGVHRAGLLTEATVDTFGHVYVISRCPPAAVSTGLSLNRDCLGEEEDSGVKLGRQWEAIHP